MGPVRRWSRTVVLALVVGFFALPFVTVGCVPVQVGSQSAGGSTGWSGLALALGLDPARGAENLLPREQWLPDDLGLQPLVLVALLVVLAALAASVVVTDARTRRLVGLASAALAGVLVLVSALVTRSGLVALVTTQVGTQDLGDGRTPSDFVGLGAGVVLSLVALLVLVAGELVALLVARRRAARGAVVAGEAPYG
ncbi:hypothetical protein GCM10028777_04630 [Angustibacter speluncae]